MFGMFVVVLMVACSNDIENEDPLFGPVTSTVIISPSGGKVAKSGTLTLTTTGTTAPVFWSISTTSIGVIVADTGVFTATTIAGTATITAVDAVGKTGTASIEVVPDLLTVDPAAAVADTAGSTIFTASGGTSSFVFSIANDSSSSSFTLPTLTTATLTATADYTIPTALQGDQTFTLSVTDVANGDVGSAKLILLAP